MVPAVTLYHLEGAAVCFMTQRSHVIPGLLRKIALWLKLCSHSPMSLEAGSPQLGKDLAASFGLSSISGGPSAEQE